MKVAVIIPTYNRPRLLMRALQSLEMQTHRDLLAIVVNDGGNAVRLIGDAFGAQTFDMYRNSGTPAATNAGVKIALGAGAEAILTMGDDDEILPEGISALVDALSDGVAVAYGSGEARFVREREGEAGTHECFGFWQHPTAPFDPRRQRCANHILTQALLAKREVWEHVGLIDPKAGAGADWDWELAVQEHYQMRFVPTTVARFEIRVDGSNQASSSADWTEYVFAKHPSDDPDILAERARTIAMDPSVRFDPRWALNVMTPCHPFLAYRMRR